MFYIENMNVCKEFNLGVRMTAFKPDGKQVRFFCDAANLPRLTELLGHLASQKVQENKPAK